MEWRFEKLYLFFIVISSSNALEGYTWRRGEEEKRKCGAMKRS